MATSQTDTVSFSGPLEREIDRVVIRPYPKMIIYYPTLLVALVCGLVSYFTQETDTHEFIALVFFGVLFVNTVIVALDFPQWVAIAVTMCIVLLFAVLVILQLLGIAVFGLLVSTVLGIKAVANHQFYFVMAGILGFTCFLAWVVTRFDYWVVMNNEVLHQHGPFGNLERYPAPQLKIDKEIADVFEYLLFGSGRLILYPTSERQARVLDNVFRIDRIEREVKRLLEALEVRVEK